MAPVDSDEAMQRHLLPSRKEEVEKLFKTVEEDTVVPYRNPDKIVWRVGEWQECSVSCGEGISERTVDCINLATNETDNSCFKKDKPDTINSCSSHPCPIVSGSVGPQERCTGDKMPYTRCQLLKSRGNCQYLKYKMECCSTCG
ncbi:A disintegrin and metalloproteinase with thrombospondin motifs 19-like [Anneissia japonica]|uniref:A disintegrin and metalloproteinase with thrombospondin motifs 19-like n=1 Tax=Anneissia japonica TaxID=1529436 RepID=UPI001425A943|nr:A disintegrin and metalloproteinase with thrombospondin motifs 19-like [Anneissia japonica]